MSDYLFDEYAEGPRALLLQRAREFVRGARWWKREAEKVSPPSQNLMLTALGALGRANALREFAQRLPVPCDECSGQGHGLIIDRDKSVGGRFSVYRDAPRMCRECLGGGVRLG